MSTDDGFKTAGSGFAKPAWVIAAVVIGLLVVVGIIVSVVSVNRDAEPTDTAKNDSSVSGENTRPTQGDSVCGLNETVLSGTLDRSPQITWANVGTVSYPVSEQYGAGEVNENGIATCFSRTPQGAALAAATGVAFNFSPEHIAPWREYGLAEGEAKDALLSKEVDTAMSMASYRIRSQAVNLLSYDGTNAVVDVGISIASDGNTRYFGAITPLIWENGDWRVNYTLSQLDDEIAQLPSLSGYVAWSGE